MAKDLSPVRTILMLASLAVFWGSDLHAQRPPYDVFPPAEPPYYRVRYEASKEKGELPYSVNYTLWIPQGVKWLRGVIVHQHGCGEGSCKSGLTGAFDLHWQALAKKHDCALLAPSYEQPDKADCQMWCDPRNGSDATFQKCLVDLGAKSGHPELPRVPWALWGHSGGGHWAGGMVLLHPERVAAAWLRSGVPLLTAKPGGTIKAYTLPDAALKVPMMCNLGTKEGVTVKDRFAGVWPANETFFNAVRGKGGLIGVAIDPLSSHDCGNQRYLAIVWLDACLSAQLPKVPGDPLLPFELMFVMPTDKAWLAPVLGGEAVPAAKVVGDPLKAGWLPNEAIAKAWMEYVKDTAVADRTPPPAPTNVRLTGTELTWEAEADLESGLASFVIERDGKLLAKVPEQGKNPFGRPVFQNLQYSDTPTQPLVPMRYTDTSAEAGKKHAYRVIAVNTVGLMSTPGEIVAQKKAGTSVVWNLDNLESIGGHKVTVVGKPRVIDTDQGKAIEFDGKGDGVFVAANPLAGLKEFTAEVIFRPAAGGPKEQRFLHFQPNGSEDRLLFETRLTPDGKWFLDTYLESGKEKLTLFAKTFLHPIGTWHHAAVVVDGKTMRHYVDGKEELAGDIQSAPLAAGQTSIGVRFNQVFWYQGAIRQIRVTPAVLKPDAFLKP